MTRTPRSGLWHRVRRVLGRGYLKLLGWRIEGEVPSAPKYVAIAAPHTSYWDFPHMIAFGFATGQYISFLMKASMFAGPLGPLFRGMGGIPVDRTGTFGLVDSVVREFGARDELIVVIAPEGTRRLGEHWKSGFYQIALKADIPIAMGFMDYGEKVVGYGPLFHPTGDEHSDARAIADFYAEKTGRYPAQATPASFRQP